MAEIGYAITANLIDVLGRDTIQNICKLWNYQSQLERLKQTVSTIQQVFLDADTKWDQLSNQDRDFIRKLKDVVYDAEDVFDEFRTRAELSQLGKKSKVRKFFGKVRGIFSSDKNHNKVYYAYQVSRDVEDIREKLDAIASEHKLLELKFDNNPIVRRSEETCSYINATKIIGRDKDKESIIRMLLDPRVKKVTIVGMGGLGKTALAQLVFNDEKIEEKFRVRLWVCVSDQEGRHFDVKEILCKILELITDKKVDENSTLEFVQKKFQEEMELKKEFLLVLDDVWNEDSMKWDKLEDLLSVGRGGSKIMVTTRSENAVGSIGYKHVYRLNGLSQEDSQHLFEISAFGEGEKDDDFVEIGVKIVGKCHRNPLAIKVIGSLLFGQDLCKWESVEKSGLAEINEGSDRIMPILKLSFNKLTPSLKSCFTYCAIFPKDFEMDKEMLISLWMSQGYIVPFDRGQTVEDAAEEYFFILMKRCFFQDIKKDNYGNVVSVKIHDLMHDVAQKMGRDEICVVTSSESNLGEKIRHVSIVANRYADTLFGSTKIRSFICQGKKQRFLSLILGDRKECLVDKQVEKLKALRVLKLSYPFVYKSLHSIDTLLLLRYLNLRNNISEVLPDSITRLHNLETLILNFYKLTMLPKDFCKLVNLRHLDVRNCQLQDMPIGMDKLTKLRVLPYFVAGGNSNNELKVLQVLTEIRGHMYIQVRNNYRYVGGVNNEGGGYLESVKHLIQLTVRFEKESTCGRPQDVLKSLMPSLNLKGLNLYYYKGTTIPWSVFSTQHHCVHILISECPNLVQIPALSKLPHLKSLELRGLNSMEYMEDEMKGDSRNDAKAIAVTEVFPSLESLVISSMEKLKGWWKVEYPEMRLRFPLLSSLQIEACPKFTSFVPSSNSSYLPEHEFLSLRTLTMYTCGNLASNLISPTLECLHLENLSESWLITAVNSKHVQIDKVGYLNSLSTNCLTRLHVSYDKEVECVLDVVEVVQMSVSTIQTLVFSYCMNLSRLSGLEYLTALEELILDTNTELSIREEDEEPWKSLHHTLRKLVFAGLPEMQSLPIGMRHLTSLQSLKLCNCDNVEGGLPEWLSCLSSLQFLYIERCIGIKSLPEAIKDLISLKLLDIVDCPDLNERCKKPNGEDFPKIMHIPEIKLQLKFLALRGLLNRKKEQQLSAC